jgi:protein-S-isoprenylcysteine O-methyltransferase Ste14
MDPSSKPTRARLAKPRRGVLTSIRDHHASEFRVYRGVIHAFRGAYDHLVQLTATLIVVCWIAWVLMWIGTAIIFRPEARDPSSPRRRTRSRQLGLRLVLIACIILAVRTQHVGTTPLGHGIGWVGIVVCVVGIAVATWARVCLGRSWGMPMTVRAKPALVRRGPYRAVRHPIYSGLLLALLGSAVATGSSFVAAAIGSGAYFVMSLRVEEADMAATFPDEYPEYAKHTKRLIPFVY